MSKGRRPLLVLLQAGMELSWLYACVIFITLALIGRALPFGYSLVLFAAAAIVGQFSLGRGWRNYLVLATQTICLAGAIMATLYAEYYTSYRLFSGEWIRLGLYGPHTKGELAEIILLSFSVLAYWIGGTFVARRRMTYYSVCSRFDIGLAAFFCLFLIELVVVMKGGPRIDATPALYSLLSFLLLSLLSIGISKAKPDGSRSFLPGYGIVGIVTSFSAVILLGVTAVILFFLPALRKAAEASYIMVETGGHIVGPFAIAILRFLFAPRSMRPEPPSPSSKGIAGFDHVVSPSTWLGRLLEDVMQWGMKAFFLVMLLFATGLLVYLTMIWLLRKSGSAREQEIPKDGEKGWLSRLWYVFISFLANLRHRLKGRKDAGDFYRALQSWGRRSGLPPRLSDTPSEFGSRLRHAHPALRTSVDKIVDAFNLDVYGSKPVTDGDLTRVRSCLRSLQSPRHWLRRLKTRLLRSGL